MILLVVSALQGSTVFYSVKMKNLIKPVYNKALHNLTSILCLAVGMTSLIYGYQKRTMKQNATDEVRSFLITTAIVTTILSIIGAFKSCWNHIQNIFEFVGEKHPI